MRKDKLNSGNLQKIHLSELEAVWSFNSSAWFQARFSEMNLGYFELDQDRRDKSILEILTVLENEIKIVGPHRSNDWEIGWGENLKNYLGTADISEIKPKYFGKIPVIRWRQNWIEPVDQNLEIHLLELLQIQIFEEYIKSNDSVYEFGCGTGHNLLRLRQQFREIYLCGLDWAESSQRLIRAIAEHTKDDNLFAKKFDYFHPEREFKLKEKSVVFTVASLEQTGPNFVEFIDYLLDNKPRLVIHIEPMWETLDQENLLDNLSVRYFKKRGYLDGLVSHIRNLESDKKLQIVECRRSFLGSFFIDGYSILVWKPMHNK